MEHATRAVSALRLAQLVAQLSEEREPLHLVERAHTFLARELGGPWSAAIGSGAAPLGDLHRVDGDPGTALDPQRPFDPQLAEVSGAEEAFPATPHAAPPTAQNESDAPLRVVQTDAYFCLSLQRVDATRLVFTYARPIACSMQDAADLLRAVGALLRARLDDLFEVDAVRAERTHLDRRVSELSLLFKSIDVVLSAVELPKVMRAFMTCVTAGEAIGFNRAFLFLLDEQHNDLRGALAVGPSTGEEAGRIWDRLRDEDVSLEETLRRGLDEPQDESVAPASLDERVRQMRVPLDASYSVLARAVLRPEPGALHWFRGQGHEPFAEVFDSHDFVVVPIVGRERTVGVLVADNLYTREPIDDERVELVSGLASHVGVIIENVLVFNDVSRRYAELSEVQSINRALLSSTDFVEVLGRIAQISASMLQAEGSLLFVVDASSPDLRLEMQFHSSGAALSDASVRRCTEIAIETLHGSGGTGQRIASDHEGDGALDLVSAPMRIDSEVAGVLIAYRHAAADLATSFDENSRRFLSIIADQAAIAVLSGRRLQTIRDDQRRIQSLNELLYRNEKLAALGEAASMIAHEIRNPLTALGGFARRMLRSSNLQKRDRDAAQIIVDETARLERILNAQLAFVRSARLERSATSLNDLVRESRTLLRAQLDDSGLVLELDLEPDVPEIALDADRMKQVLVNLVMNAIDAVDDDGRIRISTRYDSSMVELEVANTGPPIAPEHRATLFEPFTTMRQDGTGLGLAVVYQIVTEHDATIEVLSEHEWGTIFRIRLDATASPTASESQPPPHEP